MKLRVYAGLWSFKRQQFLDWVQRGAMPKDELLRLVRAVQGYFKSIRYFDSGSKDEAGFTHGGATNPLVVIGYSRGAVPAKQYCQEHEAGLLVIIDGWGGNKSYGDGLAKKVVRINPTFPIWAGPLWLIDHIALPAKKSTITRVTEALDELNALQGG